MINNGIDAVKKLEEKWVHVEITEDEKFVLIKIMDSGKGIPKEIQNKLFQPFFTTKDVGEGTGLGLSIVKGIVDEHLGSIELVNDQPHTCFLIKLPKVRSSSEI
jgi:signal transduction histidine kinase